jgi:N6-adenosine-specific RNA methylase IME4
MSEQDTFELLVPSQPKPPADIDMLAKALSGAQSPDEVRRVENGIDMFESYMRAAGLWTLDQIRPVNETRMRARWKLGRLLAAVERGKPGPASPEDVSAGLKQLFGDLLKTLGLDHQTANEAERIGMLPEDDLEKALAEARANDSLTSFNYLITVGRPYWYKASRQKRHQTIAAAALMALPDGVGPFPLIYADPPWKFDIYSEKGLERTPDQHYPTLSDQEIIDFEVGGKPVAEIAQKDAALFLWCTSSNLQRALAILEGWGFTFKSSAVWVKDKSGLGLVFRNQHEVLLYGTKGNMPGPQYQPSSVFQYPRGRHSAKPPEIRSIIERMYPDFDARTRLEIFSRDTADGWTHYGFEANSASAA